MLNDVKRAPLSGGKPDSAVVLLHGLGDSGQGLIDLADSWAGALPETAFFAPDAPDVCESCLFGFQWFSPEDWTPSVVLKGVQKSAESLNAYLDSLLATYELPSERLALVGFSQGTIMSLYVGPRREKQLAGILGYSGALIGGQALGREKRSSPPIMLVHGTSDEVLPFEAMTQAENGLQAANLNVSAVACPGVGHSIDTKGLREGETFLRRVLSKQI